MKKIFIFLFAAGLTYTYGQVITLTDCFNESLKNNALYKNKELIMQYSGLKQEIIMINKLPSFDFKAQATYQSDMVTLNLPILGFTMPELPKDQYKITCDISQVIYDGGAVKSLAAIEKANEMVENGKVEVELSSLKQKICISYFSVLILQENEKLIKLAQEELKEKLNIVESGVKNGLLLSSSAKMIKAEIIKLEQSLIELTMNRKTGIDILEELIKRNFSGNAILQIPSYETGDTSLLKRPEMELFRLQKNSLEVSDRLIASRYYPKIVGFGQAGYGRPGLNMLNDEFDSFYLLGINLSCSIYDWNQKKKERQILNVQKNMIDNRMDAFSESVELSLQAERNNIEKYKLLMEKDQEIISLRQAITKNAESQLENGLTTTAEYITFKNLELLSKINYETHKLLLIQAKVQFGLAMGDL